MDDDQIAWNGASDTARARAAQRAAPRLRPRGISNAHLVRVALAAARAPLSQRELAIITTLSVTDVNRGLWVLEGRGEVVRVETERPLTYVLRAHG